MMIENVVFDEKSVNIYFEIPLKKKIVFSIYLPRRR